MILRNELGWLKRKLRGYPEPLVIYDPNLEYSGCFEWPTTDDDPILCIDEEEFSAPFGAIVLGSLPTSSTLAHEYRHFLQLMVLGYWEPKDHEVCPYEHDAFAFEIYVSGEDEVSSIYSHIFKPMSWIESVLLPHRAK